MRTWTPVMAVIVISWTMKAIGPLVVGDRPLPATARHVIALMAPVLLASLVVVELGGERWSEVDAQRLLGVGAAGVAHVLKAPLLLAVLCGVVTAALARLLSA
jgi:branched-subunit amino acid transport protein